jgi:hypothetical protein
VISHKKEVEKLLKKKNELKKKVKAKKQRIQAKEEAFMRELKHKIQKVKE